MIIGALQVFPDSFIVREYVDFVNSKLSSSNVLFGGKVSLLNDGIVFFNIRFWLFNPSFLSRVYSFAFVKGLKKRGYVGDVVRVSSVDLSKLLEGYL